MTGDTTTQEQLEMVDITGSTEEEEVEDQWESQASAGMRRQRTTNF